MKMSLLPLNLGGILAGYKILCWEFFWGGGEQYCGILIPQPGIYHGIHCALDSESVES